VPRGVPWPGRWKVPPLIEAVDGGYRVNLGRLERRVLQQTFDDLRVLLAERDPSTRRLFPNAYVDQPKLEAEYQRLVGEVVAEQSIDGAVVDRAGLEQWMRSINAVRLVIGTRLDIAEDMAPVGRSDPDYAGYQLYEFLGQLLYWIIATLSSSPGVDPAAPGDPTDG
jgi:hypothetical protein